MQVFGFHHKLHDGFAGFFPLDFDAADVGIVVGDDSRHLLQHAGTVVAEDGNFDRVTLRTPGVLFANAGPLNRDAAVALV